MNSGATKNRDFLGSGLAFPFALDSSGCLAMNSLEDHVRQSILLILRTAPGERVMNPDFGAGLNQLAFEPLNQATLSLAQHQVQQALVRFEPRIEVLSVSASINAQEQNQILINLQYRIRSTDVNFNLVYPFFVERGEG